MVVKLVALIASLGLETLAVAAALGAAKASRRQRRRGMMLFTGFEVAIPLIGFALGLPVGRAIGRAAEFGAIGVLFAFGVHTLFGYENEEEEQATQLLAARGPRALTLALGISLEEFAIGFTLGLLRAPRVIVIALIALQALNVTQVGMRLGHRVSERFRERSERLAGLVLTSVAVVLLVAKMT